MHLFLDTRTSFSMYHSHWRYLIRGPWLRFLFQSNTITIRILSKCQEYDNLWLVLGAQRIFADHAFNVTHDSAIVQRAGHHETYPWLILYKITNNKWAILVLKYPLWWLLPRNKRPKTSEKHEIRTVNLTDWFEFFPCVCRTSIWDSRCISISLNNKLKRLFSFKSLYKVRVSLTIVSMSMSMNYGISALPLRDATGSSLIC